METPNDAKYYRTPDEQDCPNCGTGHTEPPDSFNRSWYICDDCGKVGCGECFAVNCLCEDCYKEEED